MSIILLVDCLPLTFVSLLDDALRNVGFSRHDLHYRFAALPTITEYNKPFLLSGKWQNDGGNYDAILKARAKADWNNKRVVYLSNLKGMSGMAAPQEAAIILLNFVDGDELLHSDVESKSSSYDDELHRLFVRMAESVKRLSKEWAGPKEHFSVYVVTDHGACRILEEEKRSFDSTVVNKLFPEEKHRFAATEEKQVGDIPDNLWALGHRFKQPFVANDKIFFLPKGHNTVRQSGRAKGYLHGGSTPEEVIVPTAVYKLVKAAWKTPAARFLDLDLVRETGRAKFYIQRVVTLEVEIQNPNAIDIRILRTCVTSPETDLKSCEVRYAAVIPGGKLSAPALFFNSNTKRIGLIPRYDVVVVDEIQKIHTDASGEAMAALKMYLESGRYRRATGDMGTSESGFVMLGNIKLGINRLPLYESDGIFKELPTALQESAFIDRIHGLIEGWFMPRVSRNTPSRTLGFKGDFFSEVLHELRVDLRYADYVSQSLDLPQCDDMRDTKAISRLAEGYLKLLFPDLKLTDEDFIAFCVNPAVRMRQQIRDELSKMDQEYKWTTIKSRQPDEFQESHPEEKPEPSEEKQVYDPLAPGRPAEEMTLDIKEGQRGISFARLFAPYLKGATLIKVCDPYIRLQYQIYNFMNFCEILEPSEEDVKVELNY